jgi:hypothetical protein
VQQNKNQILEKNDFKSSVKPAMQAFWELFAIILS